VVHHWHQPILPKRNLEIREQRFFGKSELPSDAASAVSRRLAEVMDGVAKSESW
jgi:hypothetical protein